MLADPSQPADSIVLKAGGIDLLDLMKEGLLKPNRVVNLRALPGLDTIAEDDAGVRIGALATLEQIAAHPLLRQRYTALVDAAGSSAGQPAPATYVFRLSTSFSCSMMRAFTTSPMLIRPTSTS
jgi:hypothetical protein